MAQPQQTRFTIGNNIEGYLEGDEIVLRIKKNVDLGPSQTGKTRLVANSSGFQQIPGTDLKFSGTVTKKP